jgi:putative resolvase
MQPPEPFLSVRTLDDYAQSGSRYGGMNFKRKVFTELMDAVGRGEISKLIVAHKDRLVRFGFAWFSHFCEINGCELLVLNAETLSARGDGSGPDEDR